MGQIAGGILGAGILTSIGNGIMNIGRQALDSYASFKRLGMSLTSLVAKEMVNAGQAGSLADAMGQAGGKAEDLQGWITKLAIQSPFTQQGVADAFRMAMAYGFTTDESKRMTQAMIDFAAGSGASEYSMSKIALALGQIKAKGTLAGGEMLQLTEAGLNVRDILAKAMGITTQEVVKLQEKGLIPANVAIEAITKSLETDFAGAAKKQAGTFSGLISSLSDIKTVGLREFFEGTFKSIQPYVSSFVDTLSSEKFMTALNNAGGKLGEMVTKGLKFFEPMSRLLGGFINGLVSGKTPLNAIKEGVRSAFGKEGLDMFKKFTGAVSGNSGGIPFNRMFENVLKMQEVYYRILSFSLIGWFLSHPEAFATASAWSKANLIPIFQNFAAWFTANLQPALSVLWTSLQLNIPRRSPRQARFSPRLCFPP